MKFSNIDGSDYGSTKCSPQGGLPDDDPYPK